MRDLTSDEAARDRYEDQFGQDYPYGRDTLHQQDLDERDRLWDKGGDLTSLMRHHNRLDRQDRLAERRERAARREKIDETRVRSLTHPRTGMVEVQPLRPPLDEAA